MSDSVKEEARPDDNRDRAPVHTDWWTGRQEAKAADVLKLDRVRRHLRAVRNLPVEKNRGRSAESEVG